MQPRQNRARLRPRARGFDRGIEREKVCLSGDIPDQVDDFSDLLNRIGEPGHVFVCRLRFHNRMRCDLRGPTYLTSDFTNRRDKLFGGTRRGDHVGGRLVRCLHGTGGTI
ncbi:MAG TPA: hypothetical protein VKP52_00285 [Pseudolabrys sp.]|nr:hypothetical protein [Pseudolabrys sp.]